jgi:hypothetical protein
MNVNSIAGKPTNNDNTAILPVIIPVKSIVLSFDLSYIVWFFLSIHFPTNFRPNGT